MTSPNMTSAPVSKSASAIPNRSTAATIKIRLPAKEKSPCSCKYGITHRSSVSFSPLPSTIGERWAVRAMRSPSRSVYRRPPA